MSDAHAAPASQAPETGPVLRRARDHHPSPKEYIRIAVILALVTAAEVGIYYVEALSGVLVPLLLGFAAIKFVLVILWFMHLRFDSRTYSRFFVMGLAGAVTLYVIVLLTFGVFSGGSA